MMQTWHKSGLFILPQRMQLSEATVGNVKHELLRQFVCIVFLHVILVVVGGVSRG